MHSLLSIGSVGPVLEDFSGSAKMGGPSAMANSTKPPSLGQLGVRLDPAWHRRLYDLAGDLGAEFSSMIRDMLEYAEPEFRRRAAAGAPAKSEPEDEPAGWPRSPTWLRLQAMNSVLKGRGIVDDPSRMMNAAYRAGLNNAPHGRTAPATFERAAAVMKELGELARQPKLLIDYAQAVVDLVEESIRQNDLRVTYEVLHEKPATDDDTF